MSWYREQFGSPWLLLLALGAFLVGGLLRLRVYSWSLDIGTPQARPYLLNGFFADEGDGQSNFCWSGDGLIEVKLPALGWAHHLDIRVATMPQLDPVQVTVDLDGEPVGVFAAHAGIDTFRLELRTCPREGQHLRFHVDRSAIPAELNPQSGDRRRLSVAFDSVTFLP